MILDKKPFIIADVGSNHRGSLDLALQHIDAAKECGVDAVKFQLYSGKELYGVSTASEVDRHSIIRDWLPALAEHSRARDLVFLCTAFSPEGVKIVDEYVPCHKVASSEMKHVEILDAVKATGKPFIVSTGGAHFEEVKWLIDKYAPTAVLECVALYPAEPKHYNLECLDEWFTHGAVGVSDHTLGDVVAVTAVGFEATIFEKHFDCQKVNFQGDSDLFVAFHGKACGPAPDSPVSLGPELMKHYVETIHAAFSCVGDGIKRPAHQHEAMLRWRRRLIATRDLEPGDILERGVNFGIYRSLKDDTRAAGPEFIGQFDGKRMKVALKAGDGLWRTDIE